MRLKRYAAGLCTLGALVCANAASAEPSKPYTPPKTRAEAITMQESRLAELKKMSDTEWNTKQAERRARRAERMQKLRAMTPEQRAALRNKMHARP